MISYDYDDRFLLLLYSYYNIDDDDYRIVNCKSL